MTRREQYLAVVDEVFTAYGAGRFADGLARLDSVADGLDAWQAELAYHRACLLGASGEPDAALAALQAASAAGGWWDPEVLRDEDDLVALRGRPDFEALIATSAPRWEAGQVLDRSGDILLEPSGLPRGVLVALHGAEEDASDAVLAWGAARDVGLTVLARPVVPAYLPELPHLGPGRRLGRRPRRRLVHPRGRARNAPVRRGVLGRRPDRDRLGITESAGAGGRCDGRRAGPPG